MKVQKQVAPRTYEFRQTKTVSQKQKVQNWNWKKRPKKKDRNGDGSDSAMEAASSPGIGVPVSPQALYLLSACTFVITNYNYTCLSTCII